ncbi:Mn2+/Fe2+ NRAMP family transporter [Bradyrhizobium elkanii]
MRCSPSPLASAWRSTSRIDPIKALYWSAVINGVLAAPVMAMLMLLVRDVMDRLVVEGWLYWLGWASMAAMGLCIVCMAVSMLMPGSS